MDAVRIPYVSGNNPYSSKMAKIINIIISEINNKGPRNYDAILYLGHKQIEALHNIEIGDPVESPDNMKTFCYWRIIKVHEPDYLRLI